MSTVLDRVLDGSRSTRYARIKKFKELGVLEYVDNKLIVNEFSPYTWRLIYSERDPEYLIFRSISVASGVLTGMRVVGLVAPNPYSDIPVYEVYVPREKADVFASMIGLRDDIVVYSRPESLFKAPLPKTIILAYTLNDFIEYENTGTPYGFPINKASMEQALVDIVRNDYWYYRGIVFEVFYYARKYIDPEKTLDISRRLGVEKRLFTIDYVVSETLGVEPLFSTPKEIDLDTPVNLVEIVNRLGDVLD